MSDGLIFFSCSHWKDDPERATLPFIVGNVAATADQEQESPTGMVVVLVHLEVLGQVGDPLGEHRDLNLRRAGVALMLGEPGDDLGFRVLGEHERKS